MTNYIESATVNIQDGLLVGTIAFQRGLNIISGENGTLKTKALQALKGGGVILHDGTPCRRQAYSPRRNALRRAFSTVFDQLRRNNSKLDGLINERNINDGGFEEYPALGDLFYVVFDDLCKDGGNQIEKMEIAAHQFNSVIRRVFSRYELDARWDHAAGRPIIDLVKNGVSRVPLEGLSLGEQEVLALVTNLYASRDRYDVFLIDEPEVHLNWHLEERLFDFFDHFCSQYERQMVVVTHSRVIFTPRFYPKTQFFCWGGDGRIEVTRDVSGEQRRRIAGEAIEIIRLGDFARRTIFVEDNEQELVVAALNDVLGGDVVCTQCGQKANVRSLFRTAKREGGWARAVFLEDGDGEGNPYPGDPSFIHLAKYCVESYLLDLDVASAVSGRSVPELRVLLFEAISRNRDKIFRKNKFFEFLAGYLTPEHLTDERLATLDAAEILPAFLESIGMSFRDFVAAYVTEAVRRGNVDSIMPRALVDAIRESVPAPIDPPELVVVAR